MEKNYIQELICKIMMLQKQDFDAELSGCDRPFLGPAPVSSVYNTRPVQLYNAYTGTPWSFSTSEADVSSDTFRIESMDDNTVTVRLLESSESGYTNTNLFATIHISTIGAIRCLADTFITL